MSFMDRLFAIVSLLAFAGFLGILVWFVPKPGLVVVCVISVLLAAFDFTRSIFIRRWRERSPPRRA
jgi:hypothetical protein